MHYYCFVAVVVAVVVSVAHSLVDYDARNLFNLNPFITNTLFASHDLTLGLGKEGLACLTFDETQPLTARFC